MIKDNINKWNPYFKLVEESENFVLVKKKRFRIPPIKNILELLENMKAEGYKCHLENLYWNGEIFFEKEVSEWLKK